jgi:chromosome segregation ATPase
MPENNEQRAEFEAFQKMAADADAKGLSGDANIDLANYLAPSPAKTVPDTAKETKVSPLEVPDETKTKSEPERAETETVEGEEVETEETEEETEETPEEELTPAERRLRKDQARLAKNFQDFQREKQESREELRRMREELAELRAKPSTPSQKDERGYSAEDYESYAEKAEEDGDIKTAKVARKEAEILRQKNAYAEFVAGWQKTQGELVKEYPDLANLETPLAKEVVKLLDEPQSIFKTRPDGLKYAVSYAKANLDTGSIPALKGEIKKLKQELTRLSELNSVPGDKPHRMSGVRPTSFDKMDAKDQLETLRRQARELDDMRTSG